MGSKRPGPWVIGVTRLGPMKLLLLFPDVSMRQSRRDQGRGNESSEWGDAFVSKAKAELRLKPSNPQMSFKYQHALASRHTELCHLTEMLQPLWAQLYI